MLCSVPDTNSSGCALHQVEATRHNEQMAHAPELSGDSTGVVSDVTHVMYQRVAGLVSGPISGGSRDDDMNLPPPAFSLHHDQRRLSSDVQSADNDRVSRGIASDDDESDVLNFRQRLQAWAVESRCSHAAVTSLLSVLRSHTCFSSLPSSARTFLQTPARVLNIR